MIYCVRSPDPGAESSAVAVAAATRYMWLNLNFSLRTGEGGVLTPPLDDLPNYSRVSRPAQLVPTGCAGRETNKELKALFPRG